MAPPGALAAELDRRILTRVYRLSLHFYGRKMFFLRDVGRARWFVYQQRLLFGRLLRSVSAVFSAHASAVPDPFLCETPNHRLAWMRAEAAGYRLGTPIVTPALSRRMAWTLLWWNVLTLTAHPYVFAANLGRPRLAHVHERLLFASRMRGMIAAFRAANIREVGVANDHMGQAFQLAAAASLDGVRVTYLQHGAVTENFPPNRFAKLLLWDQTSAEIYASKTDGQIVVDPRLKSGSEVSWDGPEEYTLVALSVVYSTLETLRLLRRLARLRRPQPVVIRFHPSDKKAWFVTAACRCLNIKVVRDSPSRSFLQSFDAAEIALVATSSVLLDAAKRAPDKVIWLRYLGDSADYYGVGDKFLKIAQTQTQTLALLSEWEHERR